MGTVGEMPRPAATPGQELLLADLPEGVLSAWGGLA